MNTRLVTLIVAGIFMAGPALAATKYDRPTTQDINGCAQLVELTIQTAEGNDVGPKAQDEIDRLLVDLQNQCNAHQFEQAEQTAALVRGLIATE